MGLLDDYYEGSSPQGISGLHPGFAGNLGRFLEENPYGIGISSGFRTPEHQAHILRESLGKRLGPAAVARWDGAVSAAGGDVVKAGEAARPWLREAGITRWVAPPGSSNHQRGVAADLSYEDKQAEQWAHANAEKYGLRFRMGHEGWHVEPASMPGPGETQVAQAPAPAPAPAPAQAQSGLLGGATPSALPDLPPPINVADAPIAQPAPEVAQALAAALPPAAPGLLGPMPAGGGLGQMGAGLLAAAQPKTDQGLAQLWQLAQQGGKVHRGVGMARGLLG